MGHGRSLQGSHQEEGDQKREGGQKVNAKEHRRMRRRITNRESAHRMRMKRQEELEIHQRQVRGPAPPCIWTWAACVRDAVSGGKGAWLCQARPSAASCTWGLRGSKEGVKAALRDVYSVHASSSLPSACMFSWGQSQEQLKLEA